MTYCSICTSLTIDELDDNDVPFHADLGALKLSAEAGCEFCFLCWTRIQEDWTSQTVSSCLKGEHPRGEDGYWEPSVWLRAQILRGEPQIDHPGASIWVTCGKMPSGYGEPGSNGGLGLNARLVIYAVPGTPAASRFRERLITADRNPELYVPQAATWIETCRASHKLCNAGAEDDMPTRLIDVGSPREGRLPRLVNTRGQRGKYLALSYCWGPATDTFRLQMQTMADMKKAIKEADLLKAHREVLELARSLGIPFVWIDALCIIQGDVADWEYESKQMARVYGNAELTVVAGRSSDARDGFITNNLQMAANPCALPVGASIPNSEVFVALPRSQTVGPVDTRGWCLQEKLLSRRALVFGKEQLIFQCRTRSDSEDGYVWFTAKGSTSFLQPALLSSIGDQARQREKTLGKWYLSLQNFTMRELSNPHDVFVAIASIAELAHRVLGSRYLAGLWEDDLVRGLLWKPRHQVHLHFPDPVKRPSPTKFAPAPVIRAPSWSWAAVEGTVLQNYSERTSPKYLDSSFVKVRPGFQNPDRWSADTTCGVGTSHMPSCELRLIGSVANAGVSAIPAGDYLTADKPLPRFSKAKWRKYGVLLVVQQDGLSDPAVTGLEQVVAIGFFDIKGERCDDVWCLLLIPNEGLMLRRDQSGRFYRMGWFALERPGWFDGREEVEICLV